VSASIGSQEPTVWPSIPAFYFDEHHLHTLAKRYSKAYRSAKPFPHVVIDNFLPESSVDRLLDEIPGDGDVRWYGTASQSRSGKSSSKKLNELGPFMLHFLQCLNSSDFVRFLERLTGLDGLVPDPHGFGGGVHKISRGGFLKIHADNNWDTKLLLFRELTVLLYLNREWKSEYGGDLELWNADMTRAEAVVAPLANRLVIFSNSETSYHGHPEPLRCPERTKRLSLAAYYYKATHQIADVPKIPHSSVYKQRPGEKFVRRLAGRRLFERFVPPVLLDLYRYMRRRRALAQTSREH